MSEKIYLAALYTERERMIQMADELRAAGHDIVSDWIHGEEGTREDIAIKDYEDVKRCTTLILFTKPRHELHSGGGRHVEFGLAYAWGKRCVIIGEQEHIFCHLPGVQQCHTVWQAIVLLERLD